MRKSLFSFFLFSFFFFKVGFSQSEYGLKDYGTGYSLEFTHRHELDSVEHFILFYDNGEKKMEYYYKNGYYLDTLKRWNNKGTIYHIEIYTDSGYTEIDYFRNIREEGRYKETAKCPPYKVIDDSVTWTRHTVEVSQKSPYYLRTGVWKTFYENGSLQSKGVYLPECFYCLCPDESKIIKKGFEMDKWYFKNGKTYEGFCAGCTGFLKEGEWIYYDKTGQEISREYYKNGIQQKKN